VELFLINVCTGSLRVAWAMLYITGVVTISPGVLTQIVS
jgi:hypothetical protein